MTDPTTAPAGEIGELSKRLRESAAELELRGLDCTASGLHHAARTLESQSRTITEQDARIAAHEATIAQHEATIAGMRKDAERYQGLRDRWLIRGEITPRFDELDAMDSFGSGHVDDIVDAALAQGDAGKV